MGRYCTQAWTEDSVEQQYGFTNTSAHLSGTQGQLAFGLSEHAVMNSPILWRFVYCADANGLYAGTSGNWDQTMTQVDRTPPLPSDKLEIAVDHVHLKTLFLKNGVVQHVEVLTGTLGLDSLHAHAAIGNGGMDLPRALPQTTNIEKPSSVCQLPPRGMDALERASWAFVGVTFGMALLYVVGGIALGMVRAHGGRGPRRCDELHPDHHTWRSFGGLVADGVRTTRAAVVVAIGGQLQQDKHDSKADALLGASGVVLGH